MSGSYDKTIKVRNMEYGSSQPLEPLLHTLEGHESNVDSVAFNHDGSRLVSGSRDKTVKIWNIENGGALIQTLKGHSEGVKSVTYSNDGSIIASGSWDRTTKIWKCQKCPKGAYESDGMCKCLAGK